MQMSLTSICKTRAIRLSLTRLPRKGHLCRAKSNCTGSALPLGCHGAGQLQTGIR